MEEYICNNCGKKADTVYFYCEKCHKRNKKQRKQIWKRAADQKQRVTQKMGKDALKGKIKWYNNTWGKGSIRGEDGKDYSVEVANIVAKGYRNIESGEPVIFTPDKNALRKVAIEVILMRRRRREECYGEVR